jgi:hypothetical protein
MAKFRVTMRSIVAIPGGIQEHTAVDYVPEEILDAYLSDAAPRWQSIEVSDEPDSGPAGDDGATIIPEAVAAIIAEEA